MGAFFGKLLGDLMGRIGEYILGIIKGALSGVIVFLTRIVESLSGFVDLLDSFKLAVSGIYEGFLDLVTAVFPFVPPEWITILISCLLVVIVGRVIKKKVFN